MPFDAEAPLVLALAEPVVRGRPEVVTEWGRTELALNWLLVGNGVSEGDWPLVGHISDVVVLTWTRVVEAALLGEVIEDEPYPEADDVLLQ